MTDDRTVSLINQLWYNTDDIWLKYSKLNNPDLNNPDGAIQRGIENIRYNWCHESKEYVRYFSRDRYHRVDKISALEVITDMGRYLEVCEPRPDVRRKISEIGDVFDDDVYLADSYRSSGDISVYYDVVGKEKVSDRYIRRLDAVEVFSRCFSDTDLFYVDDNKSVVIGLNQNYLLMMWKELDYYL